MRSGVDDLENSAQPLLLNSEQQGPFLLLYVSFADMFRCLHNFTDSSTKVGIIIPRYTSLQNPLDPRLGQRSARKHHPLRLHPHPRCP